MKLPRICKEVCLVTCCALWVAILPSIVNPASIKGTESRRNSRRHGKSSRRQPEYKYDSLPLKPSPIMIPLDLQESPDPSLDPDLNKLDISQLLTSIGSDYDKNFMSYRPPVELRAKPNGTLSYKFTKDRTPKEQMPDEIAALSGKTIQLSDDGIQLRIKFSRKTKRKIQKFLWSYSYCPVRYKWKQLSVRFWPRWIKVGECDNKRSCSIPAGMTCQPSKMQNIKILRYYCPSYSGECVWIKLNYPVLAQCSCGCQQYSTSAYGR